MKHIKSLKNLSWQVGTPSYNIFKTSQPILMIFGTLQCPFILNTSRFKIHQIYQTKWRPLTEVSNSDFASTIAKGSSLYKVFNRTRLEKMPIKMDCRNISKDGKIEVVHNLLEN